MKQVDKVETTDIPPKEYFISQAISLFREIVSGSIADAGANKFVKDFTNAAMF